MQSVPARILINCNCARVVLNPESFFGGIGIGHDALQVRDNSDWKFLQIFGCCRVSQEKMLRTLPDTGMPTMRRPIASPCQGQLGTSEQRSGDHLQ
jgi:hypothetical protein